MYRNLTNQLIEWKNNPARLPLILRGARQVGKTWLLKNFGENHFSDTVYINFEQLDVALFDAGLSPGKIIFALEIYSGVKITTDTLLIFDEIQEEPKALSSLKYFCEDTERYNIVCAGSLLGIALHSGTSFPVGKVQFLDLHPMTFTEFLRAVGKERYAELIESKDYPLITAFKSELIELLKTYYFVGGMPAAVAAYAAHKNLTVVSQIQQGILDSYELDFSKHAPNKDVPKIRMLWNSIPSQLAKEHKKYVYGLIREGARAKEFETALMWLSDCGLIHMVHRVTSPSLPLKAYEDLKAFKLFICDVGLLARMVKLDAAVLLSGNALFKEFKGAFTEQYVLQQYKARGVTPYYWTNERGSCEIDFLLDTIDAVVPMEVKAELNLQAKSLKAYREKFNPALSYRISMADYKREDGLVNLPLYCI